MDKHICNLEILEGDKYKEIVFLNESTTMMVSLEDQKNI